MILIVIYISILKIMTWGSMWRNMYNIGKTNNEKEFMEVLKNVLSNSKKV